jgi:pre-mRNA-splicing factor 18
MGKGDSAKDQKLIRHFWTATLGLWGRALEENRSIEEKRSGDGINNFAIFKQTELYIKPMLSMLKKGEMVEEMIPFLTEIVQHVQQREYQRANDAYERLSIGNAAWPIGVTQVGIHSRGGREKISHMKQAHVLNDETSRKYIHSMKRLMSFLQIAFIAAPSKSTEYGGMSETNLYPGVRHEWL